MRRLIFPTLCLAQFSILLNGPIVAVTLPPIQTDLGLGASGTVWIVNSYLLAFGGFLIVGGRLVDLFGSRSVFVAGMTAFGVGSMFCAVAADPWAFFAGRLVQGLGASVVGPATVAVLVQIYSDPSSRNAAMSAWAGLNAVAGGAVLALSGLLTTTWSWRATFILALPLTAAMAVSAAWSFPRNAATVPPSINVRGALLLTGAAISLILTVTSLGPDGSASTPAPVLVVLSVLLCGGFLLTERTHHMPVVPWPLVRSRLVAAALLTMSTIAGLGMTAFYFVALHLQHVLQFSPLAAGLAFIPGMAAMAVGSVAARPLSGRAGPRAALALTLLLAGCGTVTLFRVNADSHYLDVLPSIVLVSFATGCIGVLIAQSTLLTRPPDEAGLISGLVSFAHPMGAAIWLAVFATLAVGTANSGSATDGSAWAQAVQNASIGATILSVTTAILVFLLLPRTTHRDSTTRTHAVDHENGPEGPTSQSESSPTGSMVDGFRDG